MTKTQKRVYEAAMRLAAVIDSARYEKAEKKPPELPGGLLDALRKYQRQIDEDGTEVGVSRQAVDEVCDLVETLHASAAAALVDAKNVRERYNELIMAVSNKYQGETRHETALRYIRQHEQSTVMATGKSIDAARKEQA